jgi:hypothetical protein
VERGSRILERQGCADAGTWDVLQQVIVAAIGVWVVCSPAVLGIDEPAESVAHVIGPLLGCVGCVAASDVGRPFRWASVPIVLLFAALSLVPPFVAPIAVTHAFAIAILVVWLTVTAPTASGLYAPDIADRGVPPEASPVPPGWTYNPSSWGQRLPLAGVALAGFAIAGYLAAFQFGLVRDVWDPFFGSGSRTILTSGVSRVLPIPDAALGALGYVLDALTAVVGGTSRWRTMPWIVIVFGIAVGPLGAVSVLLVILQPVAFGAWCTLCLASAVISALMIGPSIDEVLASLQHIARRRREGVSTWDAFRGAGGTQASG